MLRRVTAPGVRLSTRSVGFPFGAMVVPLVTLAATPFGVGVTGCQSAPTLTASGETGEALLPLPAMRMRARASNGWSLRNGGGRGSHGPFGAPRRTTLAS